MDKFTNVLPPNRKTLQEVIFPDGSKRTVQYMRDGLILFTSGPGATYERVGDNEVVITPVASYEGAVASARAYLSRVRS